MEGKWEVDDEKRKWGNEGSGKYEFSVIVGPFYLVVVHPWWMIGNLE